MTALTATRYLIALGKWIATAALVVAALPLAPLMVAAALALTAVLTRGGRSTAYIPRFLNTYDDPGVDQGMYEPQVAAVYARYGWYVKTLYWLGVRNQCYGLFSAIAPPLRYGDPGLVFYRVGGHLFAEQDGAIYFDLIWRWNWSGSRCGEFRIGWKLFAVEQFLNGSQTCTNPSMNRPTFDLALNRLYKLGQF